MRKLKLVVAAAVATVVGLASAEPVDSYNGLVSAINGAAAGSTIKLKAGATITVGAQVNVNKALTISGGWIDDETSRGAGALSVRQPDLENGVDRSAVGTVVVRDSVFYGNTAYASLSKRIGFLLLFK